MAIGAGNALMAGAGIGLAGSLLSHFDARRQGKRRASAIRGAMDENDRIAVDEAREQYRAGAVQQGELLAHLRRLADPAAAAGVAAQRSARVDAMAGPETGISGAGGPGDAVAARAASVARDRAGPGNRLDLAGALLRLQDRQRGVSARSAGVAASRATIPLQEALFALARRRAQNQANLQATLGGIGPGWGGVAGQVLSGASSAPLLFA